MNLDAFIDYWLTIFKLMCEEAGVHINDPMYTDFIIREYRHAEIEYEHFIVENRRKPQSNEIADIMGHSSYTARLQEVESLNIHLYTVEMFQELYLSQLKACLDSYHITGQLRTFINQRERLIAQRAFEKRTVEGVENRGIDVRYSDSARSALINRLIEKFESDSYPTLYKNYEAVS